MDWAWSHDRAGNAHALTVFTPIFPGREEETRVAIEGVARGTESPFARIPQLHFSRLQIIDELVWQGGDHELDELGSAYLVFTASFDGDLDPLLDAISEHMPDEADSWWGCCVGYPGAADRDGFRRYLHHNRLPTGLLAAAYPNATVADVRESIELRERVIAFVLATQGLDAAELQERFRRTFAGVA